MADLTTPVNKANEVADYFKRKLPGVADFGIKILISLLIFFIGSKLIKWALGLAKKSFEKTGLEAGTIHFLISLLRALFYVVLIAGLATYLGMKGASIAALLGSIGIGIVFALKESLSNLAGGFILLLMQPFIIGDYVKEDVHGNEGTVVKIDLFYTTFLTPDHKNICIPNGQLANNSLTNFSRQTMRQLRVVVGISYHADIKKAKEILERIMHQDESILKNEPIEVFVDNLGDYQVELGFRAWVKPEDFWTTKWRIIETLKYSFEEEKIEMPGHYLDVRWKSSKQP